MLVDCLTEDHRWEAMGLEALAERAAGAALDRLGLTRQTTRSVFWDATIAESPA